jgi:hypothetical protein
VNDLLPKVSSDIFDYDNPIAIINMVPSLMRTRMENAREICENEDEVSLKPNPRMHKKDEEIRYAFWNEYLASLREKRRMQVIKIHHGIMSCRGFYMLIDNPRRTAYMLTPPRKWETTMDVTLDKGLDRIIEIMELPIKKTIERNGKEVEVIDHDTVKSIITCYKMLHEQRRGANVNRNININVDSKQEPARETKDIEKELKEVEDKLNTIEATCIKVGDDTTTEGTEAETPEGED